MQLVQTVSSFERLKVSCWTFHLLNLKASMPLTDITKIIDESLGISDEEFLDESYVAQPKQYDLPAESISPKTKKLHVELYHSYVESLNRISAKLDTSKRGEASPHGSEFRSLKSDEVYNLNSVYLHELYFANCYDPASEIFVDSLSHMRLQRDWGDFDAWQRDFVGCALSAREGWAVTGFSVFLKRYINIFIDGHSGDIPVGFYPCIAIDMWTHAFQDFENDRKEYLITQMRELNWNVIEERFKRAEKIAEAVK